MPHVKGKQVHHTSPVRFTKADSLEKTNGSCGFSGQTLANMVCMGLRAVLKQCLPLLNHPWPIEEALKLISASALEKRWEIKRQTDCMQFDPSALAENDTPDRLKYCVATYNVIRVHTTT